MPADDRPAAAIVVASLILALAIAFAFPLVDPDEGRNAEVARAMANSRDGVIPHLAGMPYLDKPPALFAAAATAISIFGPTPLAARLPAIAAALLTLLLLARLARREDDVSLGNWALALTASAPLFAVLSAYVIFDMPLTLAVTAVWTLLVREVTSGPDARRRSLMHLAVGLGILVKGPVMLAWAVGGSLATAALTRQSRALSWLVWIPGWLLSLGLPGLWFAVALGRHPEYARYAFLEESLERMTRSSFDREQPLWFAPAVLIGGALPWSLATPWARPRNVAARAAAGFVLFAVIFFSLSRSKLVTYLLPALPALAWWAAECWRSAPAHRRPRAGLVAMFLFTPALLVLGYPWLHAAAAERSGAALARALARSGAGTFGYDDCYSPGTDYLLDRSLPVRSALGHPITSNYVIRYRDTLKVRGQWRLLDAWPEGEEPEVRVAEVRRQPVAPPGYEEFHRDARFVAFRRRSR